MNSITRTRASERLALILSLLALVTVSMAIFAPEDRRTSRITWSSETDPNPSLLSIADPIQSLELSGYSAPEFIDEPIVFDGSYFNTDAQEQQIAGLRVIIDRNGVTATLVSPRGDLKEIVGPVQVGGATGGWVSE